MITATFCVSLFMVVVFILSHGHHQKLALRIWDPFTKSETIRPIPFPLLRKGSGAAAGIPAPAPQKQATNEGDGNPSTRTIIALSTRCRAQKLLNERKLTIDNAALSTKAGENTSGTNEESPFRESVKSSNTTNSTPLNVQSVVEKGKNLTAENGNNENGSQGQSPHDKGVTSGLFAMGAFLCVMCLLMSSSSRVHDTELYGKNKEEPNTWNKEGHNTSGNINIAIIPAATSSESTDFTGDITVCRQNSKVPAAPVKLPIRSSIRSNEK